MNETSQRRRFSLRRNRMKTADFKRVYSEGSRAKGGTLTVAVRPNGGDTTRLGLAVGKSCWKSAVRRNRVRRVFREAFRSSLDQLPAGCDIVMIASVPRLEPELATTSAELVSMSRKALRRYREKVERGREEAP